MAQTNEAISRLLGRLRRLAMTDVAKISWADLTSRQTKVRVKILCKRILNKKLAKSI